MLAIKNQSFSDTLGEQNPEPIAHTEDTGGHFSPIKNTSRLLPCSKFKYLSLPPRSQKWPGSNNFIITNTRK
jgi:hypothetical protein